MDILQSSCFMEREKEGGRYRKGESTKEREI